MNISLAGGMAEKTLAAPHDALNTLSAPFSRVHTHEHISPSKNA
jgi:hypothetical protein